MNPYFILPDGAAWAGPIFLATGNGQQIAVSPELVMGALGATDYQQRIAALEAEREMILQTVSAGVERIDAAVQAEGDAWQAERATLQGRNAELIKQWTQQTLLICKLAEAIQSALWAYDDGMPNPLYTAMEGLRNAIDSVPDRAQVDALAAARAEADRLRSGSQRALQLLENRQDRSAYRLLWELLEKPTRWGELEDPAADPWTAIQALVLAAEGVLENADMDDGVVRVAALVRLDEIRALYAPLVGRGDTRKLITEREEKERYIRVTLYASEAAREREEILALLEVSWWNKPPSVGVGALQWSNRLAGLRRLAAWLPSIIRAAEELEAEAVQRWQEARGC